MNPSEFIHPEDAAALRQLEAIPGFPLLVKKIMALGLEKVQYGLNMAQSIRLSEEQLPELYHHLPPICKKLGIPEPEFYLQMTPFPNAWTFGDTKIYITITSGLVDMMTDEELDAVIAHECGHILCRHVLYHSVARNILSFGESLGVLGSLAAPIKYALWYWQRKSELSCDRAGALVTSPETVASVMARFAGGPRHITESVNMQAWAKQADAYDAIYNDGLWNKTLQILVTAEQDHPFSAVRVREILKWKDTDQYRFIKERMEQNEQNGECRCPHCGAPIQAGWKFCLDCGKKL